MMEQAEASVTRTVRVVLASRPDKDCPVKEDDFLVNGCAPPVVAAQGAILGMKLVCLSVDPYMRCRFNKSTGADYMGPFQIGENITSGGVAKVVSSSDPKYPLNSFVVSQMHMPWQLEQQISISAVPDLSPLPEGLDPMLACGPLGMPGLSAYHAVYEQCHLDQLKGRTVVLSSCAGAVGSIAGQLLRAAGARVVGICSKSKIEWSKEIGAVDVAIPHSDGREDLEQGLLRECGEGKAVLYFDNVGGWISEAVIEIALALRGRVVVCGQISSYDADTTSPDYVYPDKLPENTQAAMEAKKATRERFFVGWYQEKDQAALLDLNDRIKKGEIKAPVEWVKGLQFAGQAYCDMMSGKYKGKVMIDCR